MTDNKRQKTEQTDCTSKTQSEAQDSIDAVIESAAVPTDADESSNLMEAILDPENVKAAIARVQKNDGAPGVDGMTVESLVPYLMANWNRIQKELRNGTYQPEPVKRVEIRKPGGGIRTLGIPTVVDRVIQQSILQVLQPAWDPTFSEYSFGFRPKRSQHNAIGTARSFIQSGFEYVVDLDLEKFFDRVNHDILMARAAKRIEDKMVLKILRAYLNAGILENGLVSPSTEGVPQGGPLSPLLSNLLLDELDKELEKRGLHFVRYADDCNIYVRTERAGIRVKESITKFLAKKLRLRVNEEKSAVGKPSSRKFLGFTFGVSPEAPRLVAPQSMRKARRKIHDLVKRSKQFCLEEKISKVGRYLRGWLNYFGHSDRLSEIQTMFGYARRRLRRAAWENWKTPKRRRQELTRRGVEPLAARKVSSTSKGAWCLSRTPSIQQALPNRYFREFGFPSSLNGKLL